MNTRLAAGAAAVLVTLTTALVLPASADEGPRTGRCHEGEGLTVILDWTLAPDPTPIIDSPDGNSILVRCIPLTGDGMTLPVEIPNEPIIEILRSAGIEAESDSIVDVINGITGYSPGGQDPYWRSTDGAASVLEPAWGNNWMVGPPYIDQAFGLTYFDPADEQAQDKPRVPPVLLPALPSPTPTPTPSATTTASASPAPSATVSAPATPGPSSSSPTVTEPTTRPTATRSASRRPTPTSRPTRSARPTTSTRTVTPTPPPPSSPPPTQSPTPTPSPSPSPEAPSPSPSPVWGEENASRTPTDSASVAPVPGWSPLATIAALTLLTAGGVGVTVRGLRVPAPTRIEDE